MGSDSNHRRGLVMKKHRVLRFGALGLAVMIVPAAVALAGGFSSAPQKFVAEKKIRIGTDDQGRKWYLGGFSGLFPTNNEGSRFLTVTDRGPNGDVTCGALTGKQIFVPAYAPRIVSLRAKDGVLAVDKVIPLSVGTQLTSGLPNLPSDENAFVGNCAPIPPDPYGIDTEGIAVDGRRGLAGLFDGLGDTYWIPDEYRPSILRVKNDGEITSRVVPGGEPGAAYAAAVATEAATSGNSLDVIQQFPEIVGLKFRKNRGFEDVAIGSFRGRTYLYTALQSPIENPNATTRKSLAIRVFRLDITNSRNPVVDREWLYLLQPNPTKKEPLADKISGLWLVGQDKILIEERDDTVSNVLGAVTRIWTADFSVATNLLGGTYDAVTTTPSLETAYIPAANGAVPPNPTGVTPATKALCVDVNTLLTNAGFVNVKIEGIAVLGDQPGKRTLAIINDNDFDLEHVLDPSKPENRSQLDLLPLEGC